MRELEALRVVVVTDHSAKNLKLDTPSMLAGCLALLLLRAGSTTLGLRATRRTLALWHAD